MKIDNSIANMEAALQKKKDLRASKDKAKLVTLEARAKTKTEKITKLQDDLANTTTEIETVKARIHAESGDATCDGAKTEASFEASEGKSSASLVTDEGKKAVGDAKPAGETKTKTFDPGSPGKSADKKTATRKR